MPSQGPRIGPLTSKVHTEANVFFKVPTSMKASRSFAPLLVSIFSASLLVTSAAFAQTTQQVIQPTPAQSGGGIGSARPAIGSGVGSTAGATPAPAPSPTPAPMWSGPPSQNNSFPPQGVPQPVLPNGSVNQLQLQPGQIPQPMPYPGQNPALQGQLPHQLPNQAPNQFPNQVPSQIPVIPAPGQVVNPAFPPPGHPGHPGHMMPNGMPVPYPQPGVTTTYPPQPFYPNPAAPGVPPGYQNTFELPQPSVIRTILPATMAPTELQAVLRTSMGNITIKLLRGHAPRTVENFVALARGEKEFVDVKTGKSVIRPFYNGLTFHRVVKNFLIQAGCPFGTGRGGPGYTIRDEIAPLLKHDKAGIVSMAPARDNNGPVKDSNGSQFFITLNPQPDWDGKFTIFGEVIKGMDVVRKIGNVPTGPTDRPVRRVFIESVEIIEIGGSDQSTGTITNAPPSSPAPGESSIVAPVLPTNAYPPAMNQSSQAPQELPVVPQQNAPPMEVPNREPDRNNLDTAEPFPADINQDI